MTVATRTRVLAATLAVLVASVFLFPKTILQQLGNALIVDEPLQSADAIVVPEWTQTAGVLEAADLVSCHISKKVVILVDDTEDPALMELTRRGVSVSTSSWLVKVFKELNVPDVESVPGGQGSEAESRMLPDWCDRNRFQTVVVISLPDHSRRLRRLLNRSMKGHATRTIIRTSRYSSFDPARWWWTRTGIRTQVEESQKLLLDLALHPFG